MRAMETEGSRQHLEDRRREINAVLAGGGSGSSGERRSRRRDDFGPPWDFASLGDYYGQNTGMFWPRR